MSISHAKPGELVDVRPLGASLATTTTKTLLKAEDVEVIRLVLPAGKEIPEHQAKGETIVQCLEGQVEFTTLAATQTVRAGQLLYLPRNEPHSVRSLESASLLLTILLSKAEPPVGKNRP